MTWTIIVTLIIVGLLFLLLEILVVPGTTVVGVVGFILMALGIWQTYVVYGTAAGHYTLAGSIVLTFIVLVLSFQSKTWKYAMLNAKIDGKTNVIDETKIKVGDEGKTVSRVVPMGKAMFNNEFYEVRSSGEFIDQETEIVVTKIEHNKIFIKTK